MIRECTEAENKVLKACATDILVEPETYKKRFQNNGVPLAIGAIGGMVLGIMLSFWIFPSGGDRGSVKAILFVSIAAVMGICMLLWNLLIKKVKRKKNIPGERFRINGGTVINYTNVSKDKAYIIFAEDDLTDGMGTPCCIKYPALPGLQLQYGERIAIVYSDSGAYIPLKITGSTRFFVTEREPENFYKTNWNDAVCIPHPDGVDMDRKCCEMSADDVSELVKKAGDVKSNRTLKWLGNILLVAMALLLILFVYFTFIDNNAVEDFVSATPIIIVILVYLGLFCICCKVMYHSRVKRLKKMRYRQKVMFHSVNGSYKDYTYLQQITVYEYKNGVIELVSYPFVNNTFELKEIPYGKVIYKYSKMLGNDKKNLYYFCLK